ncbi:DNA-processing protein DprA [Roseomonas sp. SSH11]|uniref:DNA-processing protein DprA n=1 Tax=Pararoseomonas baculiformis TaxID=2820812 RepID=A0ABS4AIL3_9PROT|nr:DNA-processing protein DprA [Pararoseomonas baculiformis]MBP0446838.1 DNA-processing protein DprA [Pararoseomonas baculiformis]
MNPADSLARLRLARTEGIGPQTFRRLLAQHGSAERALRALAADPARRFTPPDPGTVEGEHDAILGMGGEWLHLGGPGYPPLLAALDDAPPVLAALGDLSLLPRRQVAIVGSRNASSAGRRIAEDMAEALAEAGVAVTSGLARGIDAAAHAGALRHGRTIAVIPGGLDIAYPPENRSLQEAIAAEGLLLAEAPLGTAPLARHFPKRNRIVAGLCLGIVVIEAAHRSGTLITARLGAEAGREIYAVPGSPLDPRCQGSNDLLRNGARFCEHAGDVLETLPATAEALPLFAPSPSRGGARPRMHVPAPPHAEPGESGDSELLSLIGPTPVAVDEVLRRCHLSPPNARAALLELELEGLIEALPGNRVVRSGAQRAEGLEGGQPTA